MPCFYHIRETIPRTSGSTTQNPAMEERLEQRSSTADKKGRICAVLAVCRVYRNDNSFLRNFHEAAREFRVSSVRETVRRSSLPRLRLGNWRNSLGSCISPSKQQLSSVTKELARLRNFRVTHVCVVSVGICILLGRYTYLTWSFRDVHPRRRVKGILG
jgi:hypothetical protein